MNVDKLVEQKILDAQAAGDFDRLPKTGRVGFDDEDSVPEDLRLAHHLLKTQGFAPDWIEQDKTLRARLVEARLAIARSWAWYRNTLAQAPSDADRATAAAEWKLACLKFETTIATLNKEVFNFNLRVPSVQLQRLPLRASEEYLALGIPERSQ
ncbi:MAG: DUF1992 domain-containing protein [Chloroflexi bacterium]|nr:DUF1992 domain-containing protein [Chloroflexota bacterium]MCL5274529.1 DUF1992 domain-containing protein [Chloroflexota bacterium]